MGTQELTRPAERFPALFDDFFKPWNEWFDKKSFWGQVFTMPAVNITETKDFYMVSLAAPGLKKDDFQIRMDRNIMTISSAKEETKEDKEQKFTRKEYNYYSFSRSFTLPEEINQEMIEANYEDGVLKITLPRKEDVKKLTAKKIMIK